LLNEVAVHDYNSADMWLHHVTPYSLTQKAAPEAQP